MHYRRTADARQPTEAREEIQYVQDWYFEAGVWYERAVIIEDVSLAHACLEMFMNAFYSNRHSRCPEHILCERTHARAAAPTAARFALRCCRHRRAPRSEQTLLAFRSSHFCASPRPTISQSDCRPQAVRRACVARGADLQPHRFGYFTGSRAAVRCAAGGACAVWER